MSVIVDPKLGINVYAPFQSNQWEDSKKARRWLSFFASRVVMDTSCTALPASPAEGDTVLMSSSYPIHASEIARYSTELMAWEYMAPWAGLTVCDTSGNEWYFSGSAWVQNPTAGISALATTVSTHTAQIAALQAGGTGGGGSLPSWLATHPDAPPAVAGAYDDEFTADSSAWSWVNQGTATYAIGASCLSVTAPGVDGDNFRMRVKSVTGSFDLRAKITVQPTVLANYATGGFLLRNSTSGKLISLALSYNSGNGGWTFLCANFTNPTTPQSVIRVGPYSSMTIYVRCTNNGTNLDLYYSADGRVWTQIGSVALSAFIGSVDQFGIYADSANESYSTTTICDWVRSS